MSRSLDKDVKGERNGGRAEGGRNRERRGVKLDPEPQALARRVPENYPAVAEDVLTSNKSLGTVFLTLRYCNNTPSSIRILCWL